MDQRNMDRTNGYSTLHLAAARLLDTLEARPRDRTEFDAVKSQSLQTARAALGNECKPRSGISRNWLRAAARLGRALGACRKDHALRLTADFLDMSRLCAQNTCHRAQSCRGAARNCLKQFSPRVPEAVHSSVVALSERIARGDAPELAVALMPYRSKLALWAWWEVTYKRRKPRFVIPEAASKSGLPDFDFLSASRQQPTCVRLSGIQTRKQTCLDSGFASCARAPE